MRIIDDSLAAHGQPFSSTALTFVQQSYKEAIAASIINMIGVSYSASNVYILYGCVASFSGGNTIFTAGALFCNGEVFISPAQSIVTPSGGNTVVVNILTTFDDLTPGTTFADGFQAQIRGNRTASYVSGMSGTGNMTGTTASDLPSLKYADSIKANVLVTAGGAGINAFFVQNVIFLLNSAMSASVAIHLFSADLGGNPATPGYTMKAHWVGNGSGTTFTVTAPSGTTIIIGTTSATLASGVSGVGEFTYLGNDGTSDIFLSKFY